MLVIIIALIIELLILAFVAPVKCGVDLRFSLDRSKCFITVKIMRIKLAKIKIEIKNGAIRIAVNGRIRKNKSNLAGMPRLPKILAFIRAEKLIKQIECLGIIGGDSADATAYNYGAFATSVCTLLPSAKTSFVYPDFKSDRFEFNMKISARVSPLQVLRAAVN